MDIVIPTAAAIPTRADGLRAGATAAAVLAASEAVMEVTSVKAVKT